MAGAYVANDVVGFLWVPAQSGEFTFPYTRIARFSLPTLTLIGEPIVWNPAFAWVYPSVAVNGEQDLGGGIMVDGGAIFEVWKLYHCLGREPPFTGADRRTLHGVARFGTSREMSYSETPA